MSEHEDLINVLDRIAIALEKLAGIPKSEQEKHSLITGNPLSMEDCKRLLTDMLTLGRFMTSGEIHANIISNGHRINLNTLRKVLRDHFVLDDIKGWCIKHD